MQGVYQISLTDDKRSYIGSSLNCERRIRHHFKDLRANRHYNSYLQRSFNKYGESAFSFDIVEPVDDRIWLRAREQAWIIRLQTCDPTCGFNLSESAWMPIDWDSKEGLARRVRYSSLFAEINGTPEAKKRSSESAITFYSDPEERRKQSDRVREIGNRPEVVLKKSQSMKKAVSSPEQRARLSRQGTLSANDPKIRAKRSAALKVTLASPEQHARLVARGKLRAWTYQLINPNGERVEVFNLKEFCKGNGFHYPKMCEAANGKRIYKGWRSPSFDLSSHQSAVSLSRSNGVCKGHLTRKLLRGVTDG